MKETKSGINNNDDFTADRKISFIIPVYNNDIELLKECVNSILNQTCDCYDIIIVDDGSEKKNAEKLIPILTYDSRIKIITKENGGQNSARYFGVQNSDSDYVVFIDGDDYIESDLAFCVLNSIEKYRADIVVYETYTETIDHTFIRSNQLFEDEYYNKEMLKDKIYQNMLPFGVSTSLWGKAFKRDFICNIFSKSDFNVLIGEDASIVYPALLSAGSLSYINKPFYYWRYNKNSASRRFNSELYKIILNPMRQLKKAYHENALECSSGLYTLVLVILTHLTINEAHRNNKRKLVEEYRILKSVYLQDEVVEAANKADYGSFPIYTRFEFSCIKHKRILLLLVYVKLLKLYFFIIRKKYN